MLNNSCARNCVMALLLVLALAGAARAQNHDGAAASRPKLELARTDHNFGEVKQGEQVSHTFIIKNTGTATLEIKDVRPG